MNTLQGQIASIKVNGSLSLVTINVGGNLMKAVVIETPDTASYLKEGNTIKVLFKETEVVIGKGFEHNISLQNRLKAKILHIEKGELLSKLRLETNVGEIVSVITKSAVDQLQLKENEKLTAMIKTNEIMLSYD